MAMKKMFTAILTVVLVLTMAACAGTPGDNLNSNPIIPSQTEGTKPDVTVPDISIEPTGDTTEPSLEVTEPTEEVTEPTAAPTEPTENTTVPTDPAHEHSYTAAVTAPTCTQDGYTTYTCSCGESYVADQVNATGHSYASAVTAPTCTAEGYTTYTCAYGNSHVSDKVNPKGHSYGAWVTVQEPTTSATGKARRQCSACSATEEKNLDKITENHIWQTVKGYAATCTKNGLTDGVICSICNAVQTPQQIIPATGHSWWNATCSAPRKCKYCRITDGLPAEHQFTKTVNLGEAAMKYYDEKVSLEFVDYEGYTDWLAEECAKCGYLDIDSRRPAHTPMEEADIMLDKINYLREHVYGTDTWNMELDAKLVELAQIRVKELYNNFSHTHETYTNASENILYNVITLDQQYTKWKNSPDDYANMINTAYDYFGYARCEVYGKIYAVQLFWSSAERDAYYTVTEEG